MYLIHFKLASFGKSIGLNRKILEILLRALTEIDCLILKADRSIPPLYRSGVVYKREAIGQEDWCDLSEVLNLGFGDCEDLACWRAAELIVRHGIAARPIVRGPKRLRNGVMMYHIQVQLPDGSIEDPSKKLGMGRETNGEPMPGLVYTISRRRVA